MEEIVIYNLGLVILVILILKPYFLIAFVYLNYKKFDDQEYKNKWSSLYDELRTPYKISTSLHYPISYSSDYNMLGLMLDSITICISIQAL
jgi:hypothetical protein